MQPLSDKRQLFFASVASEIIVAGHMTMTGRFTASLTRTPMMPFPSKRDYLLEVRRAYREAGRDRKGQLLDDFSAFCGYHRKHAFSLMSKPLPSKWKRKKIRVRSRTYTQDCLEAVVAQLLRLWQRSLLA